MPQSCLQLRHKHQPVWCARDTFEMLHPVEQTVLVVDSDA